MMPPPVNTTGTTDHAPLSTPLPRPGGDAGGEKEGVAEETGGEKLGAAGERGGESQDVAGLRRDGEHVIKSAADEQEMKEEAPGIPGVDVETVREKSLDEKREKKEEAPGIPGVEVETIGEKSLDEERDGEGEKKDEVHQQKELPPKKETTETTQHEGNTETNSEKKVHADNIQALLDRDLHHLTRPERSVLYHEGVKCQDGGHLEGALKCYLGAITGLSESSSFEELPKCLHAVADVYFEKKEYEKAVYFIQAEKMYYETALIDFVSIQKETGAEAEERQNKVEGDQHDDQTNEPGEETRQDDPQEVDLSPDAKKGQEFENLARLCLKEGKLQLALDYCGKATKMYQSEYGEEHPVTIASLDLFTVIYADVGKKLYSDAMQKFEKEEESLKSDRSHDPLSPDTPSTAPELRHRFNKNEMKELNGVDEGRTNEDMIHHGELEPTTIEEHDDWVMTVLLMLIFFLATVFIVIVISSIYCYNNNRTGYCAQTRGDINYWYMYARHFIHDIRKKF